MFAGGPPALRQKNGGLSPRLKSCEQRLKNIVVVEFLESLVTVFEVNIKA